MKKTLLPLLILMSFSACAPLTVYKPVERVCYVPVRPMFSPLDDTKHIGGAENVETLIINIADMAAYIERLEAAVKCYKVK